jgi:RIO kinase 1
MEGWMSRNFPPEAKLEGFIESNWIDDILYRVKPGKEATVLCCRAGPAAPAGLIAAKVYHDRDFRGFSNDALYQQGRVILDRRARRAFESKTRFGREVQTGLWTAAEYETLRLLYAAGADVPRPLTCSPDVILMEFVGDDEGPAVPLHRLSPEPAEARRLFECLLHNIELWLAHDRIHADLSPFNVLYWNGTLKMIDFPQAVDPRFSHKARELLARDIDNVCRYFARCGVQADAARLADDLWFRFVRGAL